MSLAVYSAAAQQTGTYLPYRYTLLPAARIRELSTLDPARALRDIALCWAFILAAFVMVAMHPAWWTVAIAIPVIGNRYYGLFIIGHDGMHRRLFPNIRRNDFLNDFLILAPIGAITRINNRNHLVHHRRLSFPDDPDRHKHACFNKTSRQELIGYLSGILSVWVSAKAVFITRGKSGATRDTKALATPGYVLRDFVLLAGWFCALAGGLTWLVGWWAYPVLWLLPVYAFMFLGDNFRSFAEHSHPESDGDADYHRLITYTSNPVERMFVAPMNMNYHAVHHLWPSIPYYNLPSADKEIRDLPEAAGLEWRNSYFHYLLIYWLALPIPGCTRGT
jgi:fatty acid desaturase